MKKYVYVATGIGGAIILVMVAILFFQFLTTRKLGNGVEFIGEQIVRINQRDADLKKELAGQTAIIDGLQKDLSGAKLEIAKLGEGLESSGKKLDEINRELTGELTGLRQGLSDLAGRAYIRPSPWELLKFQESTVYVTTTAIASYAGRQKMEGITSNGVVVWSDDKHSLIATVYHATGMGLFEEITGSGGTVSILARELIKLNDGRTVKPDRVWLWENSDIAFYDVGIGNLPVVSLEPDPWAAVRDPVIIFGLPRGYPVWFGGEIAGFDKSGRINIDGNIFPGFSGAGVFSAQGELLGIMSRAEPGSFGLAVPVDKIILLLRQLKQNISSRP